jgi:phosphoribosyl-ATP pyrophosphohydrolase/phosphoribosyl-AMP cyclohydrolase
MKSWDKAMQPAFKFDGQGLIPAVVQDWLDGTVLMVGYMNQDALNQTTATKRVHFWSRSRQKLWEKGETSGNKLHVKSLFVDCDRDTILVKAQAVGPTCHTGERACFFTAMDESGAVGTGNTEEAAGGILEAVLRMIETRRANPQPGSYTTKLFEGGHDKILKKVAEEAGEVLLASKGGKKRRSFTRLPIFIRSWSWGITVSLVSDLSGIGEAFREVRP